LERAVASALSDPRLPQARRDAARLEGATFVDACWTLFEWAIRFDNDLSLCVWAEHAEVYWAIERSAVFVIGKEFQHVGSPPLVLDWAGTVGRWEMDCSALVAKRRGARFKDLFVNECGLFIYLCDQLILQFGRAERLADGRTILYALEDD
jgi:hypothetical protein